MGEKTKTIVKIGGREYAMRGFESEEYIHRVAIYVDRKMEEIEKAQPHLSTSMLTVLTAINLADEVLKLKDEVARLQKELERLRKNVKNRDSAIVYDVVRKRDVLKQKC